MQYQVINSTIKVTFFLLMEVEFSSGNFPYSPALANLSGSFECRVHSSHAAQSLNREMASDSPIKTHLFKPKLWQNRTWNWTNITVTCSSGHACSPSSIRSYWSDSEASPELCSVSNLPSTFLCTLTLRVHCILKCPLCFLNDLSLRSLGQ